MTNAHIGSSLDHFLEEEGILGEVEAIAVKRVIAWQLQQEMRDRRVSRTEMARRMNTSRTQLTRLLDPNSVNVQLGTLQRAAAALGKRISIQLSEKSNPSP